MVVDPAWPGPALDLLRRQRALQRGLALAGADSTRDPTAPGAAATAAGTCRTEYLSLPQELVAWTACGSRRIATRIPVRPDQLRELTTAMGAAARRADLDALREHASRLSAFLVEPQAEELRSAAAWMVTPDAPFSDVPLAWLRVDDAFLFERLEVLAAVPGAEVAAPVQSRRPRVLAFGNPAVADGELPPLPAAAKEARRIGRLFEGAAVRVADDATFAELRASIGSYDVFHYAGHVSAGGGAGRMHFAPDTDHADGAATLAEIARLPLRRLRFVFLAACSSQESARTRVAGSLGFAHAFLHAGAAEVLATLWPVDDAEQGEVVQVFYEALARGLAPAEALRGVWRRELAAATPRLGSLVALQLNTTVHEVPTGGREQWLQR
jgi:CHAT domain-containing protein